MITDSRAIEVKTRMTEFLIAFHQEGMDGDDTALDIIEFIAMRLQSREDYHVAALGFFVRTNLLYFARGHLDYPEVHFRLFQAALAAPLGHAELNQTFEALSRRRDH